MVYWFNLQRQPSGSVLKKRYFENMRQISRRTPMPKCSFNKIALLCNFIEIALRHGCSPVAKCSPVNLLHISRTSFLGKTSEWLLLNFQDLATCKHFFTTSCSILRHQCFTTAGYEKENIFSNIVIRNISVSYDYVSNQNYCNNFSGTRWYRFNNCV